MAGARAAESSASAAILIVDDDSNIRAILREALTHEGYRVLEARDGLQAVKVFAESRPPVVLLDILMPSKDGIEALQEMLRADSSAVVFTMTGGDWGANESGSALLLGAKRAFLKPLRPSDLLEAIREELHPERQA